MTGPASDGWRPALGGVDADRARAVAIEVAARVLDDGRVERARGQTGAELARAGAPARGWSAPGLSGASTSGALLCAELDRLAPAEGWDRRGHMLLTAAARLGERDDAPLGLYDGLAGIGYSAARLAAGRERYENLLKSIDEVLIAAADIRCRRLLDTGSLPVREWDLISGITGIGVYLLSRGASAPARAALERILEVLVELSCETGGVPRWATPAEHVFGYLREHAPSGCVNCGLAHGAPGPLALLSLSMQDGVEVAGHLEAVDRVARWLADQATPGDDGPQWPAAVPLGPAATMIAPPPARPGWCYGNAGVARALWLAGCALHDSRYTGLGMHAIREGLARQQAVRPLVSPTFCHGVAGLAHVALRLACSSASEHLRSGARTLCFELLERFDADSEFGYRDLAAGSDGATIDIDDPTLLSGAAGAALVLLGASSDRAPEWDRAVLLA